MAMGLFATETFAQEVRGVETRLAEYEGDMYSVYAYPHVNANDKREFRFSTYYGFELTNKNSIPVSVSVEIYRRDEKEDKLVATKEIVLASGESYILKQPKLKKYNNYSSPTDSKYYSVKSDLEGYGKSYADYFYVRYKAYKLQ